MRKVVFWSHLIAALTAGLLILLMSVTGVLLTYERQLIAWSDRDVRSTPPSADAAPLPVSAIITQVGQQTDKRVNAVTLASDRTAPVTVAVPQATLLVDAYSGRLLGESSRGVRDVMSTLRAWHRWMAVEGENRPLARAFTGWSNFLFLFVVLSGIYIWFPRKWTFNHVRAVSLFKGGLRGKARDFNWHNVIGIWSAVPLAIVVASALPISFPWANAAVYRMVGEEPPRPAGRAGGAGARAAGAGTAAGAAGRAGGPQGQGAQGAGQREGGGRGRREPRELGPVRVDGLDALWQRAMQQEPEWRTIRMAVANGDAPVAFAIDRGDGGQPQLRSTLTLTRADASVVGYETFSDLSLGRRIRNGMRFAHTGEILGIPGQTIAGLATAGSVVLVWTGFALALRRFRAWLTRRSTRRVPAPYPAQPASNPLSPVAE